uniref:Uncharacterized protein n=1 Tax=Solanum lycopersicum TaxID=4081 RepID=K4BRK9_SOLLC
MVKGSEAASHFQHNYSYWLRPRKGKVYNRRFKKNQMHNNCKTVLPDFQELQNMTRKTSKVSTTEGLKDSPGKAASLCVQKKPRLQASSSKNGLIVKHKKNSQINHKKKDAQVSNDKTPSDRQNDLENKSKP